MSKVWKGLLVNKVWREFLITDVKCVRPIKLNVFSRCFIFAVSLHNAHLSWFRTVLSSSVKPYSKECCSINLVLLTQTNHWTVYYQLFFRLFNLFQEIADKLWYRLSHFQSRNASFVHSASCQMHLEFLEELGTVIKDKKRWRRRGWKWIWLIRWVLT